jgi:hypothetical protein
LCNNQPSAATPLNSIPLFCTKFIPPLHSSDSLSVAGSQNSPPALVAEAEAVAAVAFHYEFLYNFPMTSYPPVLGKLAVSLSFIP